jgi:serine/threonine protein phosphatase PrpC
MRNGLDMMKVQDSITTAGGTRANEDRLGYRGTLAWVIDGATDLYHDAALPAGSDVQWLVDLVGQRLAEAGANGYRGTGSVLLDRIAEDVCQQQTAQGFPVDRVPPACSVAVAVDQGDTYDITRMGDATAIVTGHRMRVLSTAYFDHREAAAVEAKGHGGAGDEVVAAMHRRRLHTMTSGEVESVFSGHPQRRLRPHTINGAWNTVEEVLLCTDGFARLITDYALYRQWTDALADAHDKGLAYLEKLIRAVEATAGEDSRGRFKKADDIAALLLSHS